MYNVGWRKSQGKNEIIGVYGTQNKIKADVEDYFKTQKELRENDVVLCERFSSTSEIYYQHVKGQHQETTLPLISSTTFTQVKEFSFASHLTFTLDHFQNEPHKDRDASEFTFGM